MLKKLLQNIFSLKNEYTNKTSHKVISILFFKIKIKHIKKLEVNAILDCGGIGDYTFCRPFFKYLKKSDKFKNKNFIWICKDAYADMPETYDKGFFKQIITYSEKNYKDKIKYLKNKYKINTLINLFGLSKGNSYRGWLFRYNMAKNIKAQYKIADVTLPLPVDEKLANLKFYNELITTEPTLFELDRRKKFFENLTGIVIKEKDKTITPIVDFSKSYICFSLFCAAKKRNYDDSKWQEIINYLIEKTNENIQLIFLGGNGDRTKIAKILKNVANNSRCINLAGQTGIALVPAILKNAKFLIALETGTVHLAESVGCPTICMSCGSYWGRFLPYPHEKVKYIFPDGFDFLRENNPEKLSEFYQANWTFKTSDIQPKKIIQEINKMLIDYIDK